MMEGELGERVPWGGGGVKLWGECRDVSRAG